MDGLILPDLPIYEFETEYGPVIRKHGLDFVFLVTPETSEERIRKVDALSTGFLYAVSHLRRLAEIRTWGIRKHISGGWRRCACEIRCW